MEKIIWGGEAEEKEDYFLETATAEYNGKSLSIEAKFCPEQMTGEIICSITEDDLENRKYSRIYYYRKKWVGFYDIILEKINNAVCMKTEELERIARGEDL